jgi:hypothetical protein
LKRELFPQARTCPHIVEGQAAAAAVLEAAATARSEKAAPAAKGVAVEALAEATAIKQAAVAALADAKTALPAATGLEEQQLSKQQLKIQQH